MKHAEFPTTMHIELVDGSTARLQRNISDGLDLVAFQPGQTSRRYRVAPPMPVSILGFGPLWTWDANRADRRELPAVTVSRYEPEHVYKLLEGYFFIQDPGKGTTAYGPIARVRWVEHEVAHA